MIHRGVEDLLGDVFHSGGIRQLQHELGGLLLSVLTLIEIGLDNRFYLFVGSN